MTQKIEFTEVQENLGWSESELFQLLAERNINPRKARNEGIPESVASKLPAKTRAIDAGTPEVIPEEPTPSGEATIPQALVIEKFGVSKDDYVALCELGGVSNGDLTEAEYLGLAAIAVESGIAEQEEVFLKLNEAEEFLRRQELAAAQESARLHELAIQSVQNEGRINAGLQALEARRRRVDSYKSGIIGAVSSRGKSAAATTSRISNLVGANPSAI